MLKRLKAQEEVNKAVGSESRAFWNCEWGMHQLESTPGKPYGGERAGRSVDVPLESPYSFRPHLVLQRRRKQHVRETRRGKRAAQSQRVAALDQLSRTRRARFYRSALTTDSRRSEQRRPLHLLLRRRHLQRPSEVSAAVPRLPPMLPTRRFRNLVNNIRQRRGRKVIINVPIFRDTNTPQPFSETYVDEEARAAARPDFILMASCDASHRRFFGRCLGSYGLRHGPLLPPDDVFKR